MRAVHALDASPSNKCLLDLRDSPLSRRDGVDIVHARTSAADHLQLSASVNDLQPGRKAGEQAAPEEMVRSIGLSKGVGVVWH